MLNMDHIIKKTQMIQKAFRTKKAFAKKPKVEDKKEQASTNTE